MRGIIISVGNELLNGRTVNTNATEIARFLSLSGVKTIGVHTVPDHPKAMVSTLKRALAAAEVVVVTGGLGPTHDDITKAVLADYFEVPQVVDEKVLATVEKHYRSRGLSMPEVTRNQALRPANAQPLENRWGTAPGLYIFHNKRHLYALPGVPREMRGIMQESIMPQLRSFGDKHRPHVLVFRTTGIPESQLYEKLQPFLAKNEGLEAAFLPRLEGVDLRLVLQPEKAKEIEAVLNTVIGDHILTQNPQFEAEDVLGELLFEKGLTLAVAESCSGGLIQDRLTNVAGSSRYFVGGVVSYSNQIKMSHLGVSKKTLESEGAVSEAVARQMAEGVRRVMGGDLALATTGIAGPGGGSDQKPVGLVFIAMATPEETLVKQFQFGHERRPNKVRSAQAALWMAIQHLRLSPFRNVSPV